MARDIVVGGGSGGRDLDVDTGELRCKCNTWNPGEARVCAGCGLWQCSNCSVRNHVAESKCAICKRGR